MVLLHFTEVTLIDLLEQQVFRDVCLLFCFFNLCVFRPRFSSAFVAIFMLIQIRTFLFLGCKQRWVLKLTLILKKLSWPSSSPQSL